MDVLLTGGLLIDGTGAPARHQDVAVRAGRIAPESKVSEPARLVVNASGLVVAPGFVDIHTHSDLSLIADPQAVSRLSQGITTEIVGNCGLGLVPVAADTTPERRREIEKAANYLYADPTVQPRWTTTADHLGALAAAGPAVNVGTLIPHLPLRASVVGLDAAEATRADVDAMCDLARQGFSDGALGLSTGLAYSPLCFASDHELTALGSVAAEHGAVFAWHVRDYGNLLLESVAQALRIARDTGCRTQISHLCAVGERNWGKVSEALRLVDAARAEGLEVGVDAYPYLAGNAPLSQLLPGWAREGDEEEWRTRLLRSQVQRQVLEEWERDFTLGWDQVTILPAPGLGRTVPLAELAAERDVSPASCALDLLSTYGAGVNIIAGGRSPQDLADVLVHPATVVASDGMSLDPHGRTGAAGAHPRSYGCFPRYLSEVPVVDLPGAIHRCTGLPAATIGLAGRGTVRAGNHADLVVFDPHEILDVADFDLPHQLSRGISWVFVNGEVALGPEGYPRSRAGQVLRRESARC